MSIEQIRARTNDWLAPISAEAPAGSDGKYDVTHEALRTEIAMLAVGAGLFLAGRWLAGRERG